MKVLDRRYKFVRWTIILELSTFGKMVLVYQQIMCVTKVALVVVDGCPSSRRSHHEVSYFFRYGYDEGFVLNEFPWNCF